MCDALLSDPTVRRTPTPNAEQLGDYDVVVSVVVGGHRIEGGAERSLVPTDSPVLVAESVRVLCNRLTVLGRPDEWTLHAGCVALDGTGLALMAPSGTGKSTLTAYLVIRGWQYLSDELARIEPGGALVRAFPKPMNLSDASLDLLGVRNTEAQAWNTRSAEDLGGATRAGPCPLGGMVLLTRPEAEVVRPRVEALGGAERAASILANQTNFFEVGDPLDKVRTLVANVPMARLVIGDLADTDRALKSWVNSEPQPVEGMTVEFPLLDGTRSVEPSLAFGPMALPLRSTTTTAIEFADDSVLLFDRAARTYLVTQPWALRLLERADGRSTVERIACEHDVPTTAAVEFFRGAELAGMVDPSGSLVGMSS